MPRLKVPCAKPGCPESVSSGMCEGHQHQHERKRSRRRRVDRASGGPTYDDAAWRRFRLRVLRERGWRCEDCRARPLDTSELHLHHIVELRDGGAKFDRANIVVCCRACHSTRHPERSPRPLPCPDERRGWVWA